MATTATPNVIKDNPMVKALLFIFTSLIETQISRESLEFRLPAVFATYANRLKAELQTYFAR
jgi:hypothetical protein